jgi:serine/threonine-protein kinase RsbW
MTVAVTFILPRRREAVGQARRLMAHVLAELGAPPEHAEIISLALSEACTNAVEHSSGAAPFTLQVECTAGSVRLTVSSSGAFVPADPLGQMPGPTALRGRGVPLMRTLMDDFDIVAGDGRTTVTMCKNFEFAGSQALLAV